MAGVDESKGRDPPVRPVARTAAARPRPPSAAMATADYDDEERPDTPIAMGRPRPSIERAHQDMVSDIDAQMRA